MNELKKETADVLKTTDELSRQVGVRFDARQRYLAELATKAMRFETLSDYLKWALDQSFRLVSLHRTEIMYDWNNQVLPLDAEKESQAREIKSLNRLADVLWDESPFKRLEVLLSVAPHLVSDSDKALMKYIHSRADLKEDCDEKDKLPGLDCYKFDMQKVKDEWENIRAEFTKTKGKK